jgi:beta-galactosidase
MLPGNFRPAISQRILAVAVLVLFAPLVIIAGAADAAPPTEPAAAPRSVVAFNSGWRFVNADPTDAAKPDFDDSGWRYLDLPHDWAIAGPFDQSQPGETAKLPYAGVGWYRKHFTVAADERGGQFYLDVDGAMSYGSVWINGRHVGGWPYGYTSWRVDLTPHIRFGVENVIAVRLDNPPKSSRWYPGGGIYRNVWLVKTGPVHVAQWGTQITTPEVTADAATVEIQVTVDNHAATETTVDVAAEIYAVEPQERQFASAATPNPPVHGRAIDGRASDGRASRGGGGFGLAADAKDSLLPLAADANLALRIAGGKSATTSLTARVADPRLWSTEHPHLYVVVVKLSRDGRVVDRYDTTFGIRTIEFTPDEGFFLNGELTEIKGVCLHHDLGPLGAAFNLRARQRQLEKLKQLGCNAIRASHNPMEPELYDLCDRLGFLVMDEAFDAWQMAKRDNDYHRLFDEWHERDLRAMIRRDRNHPSVILWSLGNEVYEQRDGKNAALARRLADVAHEEDATRPVNMALHVVEASTNGFQDAVDVFGYNYTPFGYAEFRRNNPAIPLIGSETSSCTSTRGEYFFPVTMDDKRSGRVNYQVTSYDYSAPKWAMAPDVEFKGLDENPFVAGEFVWTGFDYLGEPTPYDQDADEMLQFTDPALKQQAAAQLQSSGKLRPPSRSSYFGIFDLAGFPKDRFYSYQARWRPELPMAHILPHWNWPERVGQVTPVHVYTSGDEAELLLNGRSHGRKRKGQFEYRLRWDDVVYEPGELKVVAYRNGQPWATEVVKTTGPPTRLTLAADRHTIRADGTDLSFVKVAVVDDEGLVVPRAKNRVRFEIDGPGQIVATDNGDPTSHVPFQATERDAFNGLGLAIVRAPRGKNGTITLRANSDGLVGAEVSMASELPE